MVSPENRAELRRLAEAATPGPWHLGKTGNTESHWVCAMDDENVIQPHCDHACRDAQREFDADAAFIAASRSAIPALLDALEEAERQRDKARKFINEALQYDWFNCKWTSEMRDKAAQLLTSADGSS